MRLCLLIMFILQSGETLLGSDTSHLEARIYPEKNRYFVGEPIFLAIEIKNIGQEKISIDGTFGSCFGHDSTEIEGLDRKPLFNKIRGCYGGYGGSCGGVIDLYPGKTTVYSTFLNQLFSIADPGTYKIRARRSIPIFPFDRSGKVLEIASDFEIVLVPGTEEQLRTVFQKYVNELSSEGWKVRLDAIQAITTMGPSFLEGVILKLSSADDSVLASIPALGRLNTSQTRARLAELAESPDQSSIRQSYIRQPAINALGETRNLDVFPVLKRVGINGAVGDRDIAIVNTGLYGDFAIPFLSEILNNPDENTKVAAVRGLGITKSRKAVPLLFNLFHNSKDYLLREVRLSLAELTHFALNGNPMDQEEHPDKWLRWQRWWELNGATAKIYGTDSCSDPGPLP